MCTILPSGRCESETPLCLDPTSLPGGLLALGSGRVMVDMVWMEGRNAVGVRAASAKGHGHLRPDLPRRSTAIRGHEEETARPNNHQYLFNHSLRAALLPCERVNSRMAREDEELPACEVSSRRSFAVLAPLSLICVTGLESGAIRGRIG